MPWHCTWMCRAIISLRELNTNKQLLTGTEESVRACPSIFRFMISADVCDALPGYKRSLGSSW